MVAKDIPEDGFRHVADQRYRTGIKAKGAGHVGGTGIAAAMFADIVFVQIFGCKHAGVDRSGQIADACGRNIFFSRCQ